MSSKVTIKIERDGEIIDESSAEMSNTALNAAIEAICSMRGYDPDGSLSKEKFFSRSIRKYVESQVDKYSQKQACEAAQVYADSLKSLVVVQE